MPFWGTGFPGCNPISALNVIDLRVGDDLELFNAADAATIATGSKSIAFARGSSPGNDAGTTFQITGCGNGTQIYIQSSNGVSQSSTQALSVAETVANMDASFNTIFQPAAGNGAYTDIGRSAFYRVIVNAFVSGDAPVVIVKR